MDIPVNQFKRSLRQGQTQIGLWLGLATPYSAELLATTGFDWLLIDGEHAPNDVLGALVQLQSVAAYPVSAIVRPVNRDAALIKQYLDIGAQTLLVPMIETAEEAMQLVRSTRYPTRGIRGVGSALARASRWNQIPDYLTRCEEELCVLVQVESILGLENLGDIAQVDGVDGVFFGPADLAASMGMLGRPGDPEVQKSIHEGIDTVKRCGKAAGTLTSDPDLARTYLAHGATFVAVGVDTSLLVRAASHLAASFKLGDGATSASTKGSSY